MKVTCPHCGKKGIPVDWLDCLSNASRVVPRHCDSCGGAAKRTWFSRQSFLAAIPMQLGLIPLFLKLHPGLTLASLLIGATLSSLLQGFWERFAPWPTPVTVPPVVIPPEDNL